MLDKLKKWARNLKRDVVALYLAARDPRVPWYAKMVAGFVAIYALSPIDLIPDFIPILGYVNDLLIVPLGIAPSVRLIPSPIMSELRERAATSFTTRPTSRIGAAIIIGIWLLVAFLIVSGW